MISRNLCCFLLQTNCVHIYKTNCPNTQKRENGVIGDTFMQIRSMQVRLISLNNCHMKEEPMIIYSMCEPYQIYKNTILYSTISYTICAL